MEFEKPDRPKPETTVFKKISDNSVIKVTGWTIARNLASITNLGVDEAHDVIQSIIRKQGTLIDDPEEKEMGEKNSGSMENFKHQLVDFIKDADRVIDDARETITFNQGKRVAYQIIFNMVLFLEDLSDSSEQSKIKEEG